MGILFLLFISFQTSFSQDLAYSVVLKPYSKMYTMSNDVVIKNAILEDGKYTYKFKETGIIKVITKQIV